MSKINLGGIGVILILISSIEIITSETVLLGTYDFDENIVLATILAFIIILLIYGIKSFRVGSIDESEVGLQLKIEPENVRDQDEEKLMQINFKDEEQARDRINKVLKDTIRSGYSKDSEFAENAISNGDWTNDKVAAAFVDKSVKYPLLERLREWLEDEEETFKRRLNRTIKAVEKVHDKGEK